MKTLQETLRIKYPVIGGPMAWTSMSDVVAAISNGGGFGVLGVGFSPDTVIETEIHKTQVLTDKPFTVNVILAEGMDDNLQRVTDIVVANKLASIYADVAMGADYDAYRQFAKKWLNKWHEAGLVVLTKVASATEGALLDSLGVDVVIAKGYEGGGHITKEGTFTLVPQVADVAQQAVVVASGGIADGRGYAASRLLGAQGVEMGSRFMLASENTIHDNVKQAIIKAQDSDPKLTGWTTGAPVWQLPNRLYDNLMDIEATHPGKDAGKLIEQASAGSLRIASTEGDVEEHGTVMVGQDASLLTKIEPAAEIIRDVYENGEALLK